MSVPFIPGVPGFSITPIQIAFGTVLVGLIPPYPGPGSGAPFLYDGTNGANWYGQPYTRITKLLYTTAGTAHSLYVMRPCNWAILSAAVAKNITVFNLVSDPGLYATQYKYPLPGQATLPASPADTTIAANDYVCYQLDDGTWQVDLVASVSSLAITMTTGTPNRNGATIAKGRPVFFFGIKTDTNPQTGIVHLNFLTIASALKADMIGSGANGEGITSLNPGDPMMVLSNNATATGLFDLVAGIYGKY